MCNFEQRIGLICWGLDICIFIYIYICTAIYGSWNKVILITEKALDGLFSYLALKLVVIVPQIYNLFKVMDQGSRSQIGFVISGIPDCGYRVYLLPWVAAHSSWFRYCLSFVLHQFITWTNDDLLLIRPWETKFEARQKTDLSRKFLTCFKHAVHKMLTFCWFSWLLPTCFKTGDNVSST